MKTRLTVATLLLALSLAAGQAQAKAPPQPLVAATITCRSVTYYMVGFPANTIVDLQLLANNEIISRNSVTLTGGPKKLTIRYTQTGPNNWLSARATWLRGYVAYHYRSADTGVYNCRNRKPGTALVVLKG